MSRHVDSLYTWYVCDYHSVVLSRALVEYFDDVRAIPVGELSAMIEPRLCDVCNYKAKQYLMAIVTKGK